jgi:hypothetical protein
LQIIQYLKRARRNVTKHEHLETNRKEIGMGGEIPSLLEKRAIVGREKK